MSCPRCGVDNVILGSEDLADQERAAIEALALDARGRAAARPGRLRDVADLLLVFGYMQLALVLTPALLYVTYGALRFELRLALLLVAGFVGALCFVLFKFLSELLDALAAQSARLEGVEERLEELVMRTETGG
jgi:hypothetical protein